MHLLESHLVANELMGQQQIDSQKWRSGILNRSFKKPAIWEEIPKKRRNQTMTILDSRLDH